MKKWVTNEGNIIYQVLSGRSNVFLITNGIDNFLVDTSTRKDYKKLNKVLGELNCKSISLLILTHAHFNHAANARVFKEKYDAKVIVHLNDKEFLESGNNPLPQGTNAFTKFLVNMLGKNFVKYFKYDAVKSDIVVNDKYDLKNYGLNAYIIHTSGHTPGSISIIVDNEIAIVGDTMFGIFKNSVFPPFAHNTIDMIKSWSELINTGCRIFLPSHGTEREDYLLKSEYQKYKMKYLQET